MADQNYLADMQKEFDDYRLHHSKMVERKADMKAQFMKVLQHSNENSTRSYPTASQPNTGFAENIRVAPSKNDNLMSDMQITTSSLHLSAL